MKVKITRFMSGKLGYELEASFTDIYNSKTISLENIQDILIKLDHLIDSHNNKLTDGDDT